MLDKKVLTHYTKDMTKQNGRLSTKIRKHLRDLLWAETGKGKLINDLLEKYFDKKY